jgi:hypothetical protein
MRVKTADEEDEEDEEWDGYCEICGDDIGLESHYHCSNCGEVCSMMGHIKWVDGRATDELTCERKEGPWNE